MASSTFSSFHLKGGYGSLFQNECSNESQGFEGYPSGENLQPYNLDLHIIGVFIILAASTTGVFMPVMASCIRHRCRSYHHLYPSHSTRYLFPEKLLILGKHFGTGIILATAFIHMMPTAMSNLSSPCLSSFFSENYTALGGLFILSSSLFMHWMEFVAVERTQKRLQEAAVLEGLLISPVPNHKTHQEDICSCAERDVGRIDVDLDDLGTTGLATVPCSRHIATILNETICKQQACTSVSSCDLDHSIIVGELNGADSLSPSRSPLKASALSNPPSCKKKLKIQFASYGTIPIVKNDHDAQDITKLTAHHHRRCLKETGHSHVHDLELLDGSQRRISTYILEAGIAAHSVIVGISLGVSSGTEFLGLLAALAFHQFFEGFALGARIADLEFEKTYTHYLLALVFSLTMPIGAAIGIGISSSYNPYSASTILIEGIFDAISTGILLYMGYVNLLAVEFNMNGEIRKESTKVKSMCFISLWTGVAAMAIIGVYA
ncbi:high-affinity Zn(2+) transporter zrt1 [Lobosporangium transversale]|uniref:Zinc/iron permease n=1 Tax=Lobosporangium transversale TaxID=64571 RepID=A0A1Y2GMK8_9FUNG|nr:Zinc/iron permease [Lobosporangium transversale]KAF9915644.1 high-affinity Zn(2+) transporter zrt1 [Lobosporangium transversale]ORZ13443.1 Zinc/iron permease [Lobosporangium transversale]|eukprot:XP_021880524.1 Zinc/iron permease [Lobosporangium transversale]